MPFQSELFQEKLKNSYFKQENAPNAFNGLEEKRKNEILEGTKISITEEELAHARNFLALIAITGGQQLTKGDAASEKVVEVITQRSVYLKQGILPRSLSRTARDKKTHDNIADQIKEVSKQITDDHIKAFYKRLIEKRPLAFYGPRDTGVVLRDGKRTGGCPGDTNPEEYVLYSEMEFGAMLQVAGPTQFINNGGKFNIGEKETDQNSFERRARIAGLTGCRFEIDNGMEALHLRGRLGELEATHKTSSATAGVADLGRIKGVNTSFVEGYKAIWNQFYADVDKEAAEAAAKAAPAEGGINEARLKKRLYLSYKKLFADAIANSTDTHKAYIRITGLGDGVWANMPGVASGNNANTIKKAIGEAIRQVFNNLTTEQKTKIAAIEFSQHVEDNNDRSKDNAYYNAFTTTETERKGALNVVPSATNITKTKSVTTLTNFNSSGIDIISRNATAFGFADKLTGKYTNCQLCVNFAWDGGSYVGNEYWAGDLNGSMDPAAACCSPAVVSFNPELNPQFLDRLNIVGKDCATATLKEFSKGAAAPAHADTAKAAGGDKVKAESDAKKAGEDPIQPAKSQEADKNSSFDEIAKLAYGHYLKPYDTTKANPSGVVARSKHGVVHACRTAHNVELLLEMHKKYNTKHKATAENLLSNEKNLKLLKLAALYHDSANTTESDKQLQIVHANVFRKDMLYIGFTKQEIRPFYDAMANKDKEGTDFYTSLIHDADCLEIRRVRNKEKFQHSFLHIFNELNDQHRNQIKTLVETLNKCNDVFYSANYHYKNENNTFCYRDLRNIVNQVLIDNNIDIGQLNAKVLDETTKAAEVDAKAGVEAAAKKAGEEAAKEDPAIKKAREDAKKVVVDYFKSTAKEAEAEAKSGVVDPQSKAKIDNQIKKSLAEQNAKINPDGAYVGVGLQGNLSVVGGKAQLKINDIFSPETLRFSIASTPLDEGRATSELKNKFITEVFVDGTGWQTITQILGVTAGGTSPSTAGLAKLAALFHSGIGPLRFKVADSADGAGEIEVSCTRDPKQCFVTKDCTSAISGLNGKEGALYDPGKHGIGAVGVGDEFLRTLKVAPEVVPDKPWQKTAQMPPPPKKPAAAPLSEKEKEIMDSLQSFAVALEAYFKAMMEVDSVDHSDSLKKAEEKAAETLVNGHFEALKDVCDKHSLAVHTDGSFNLNNTICAIKQQSLQGDVGEAADNLIKKLKAFYVVHLHRGKIGGEPLDEEALKDKLIKCGFNLEEAPGEAPVDPVVFLDTLYEMAKENFTPPLRRPSPDPSMAGSRCGSLPLNPAAARGAGGIGRGGERRSSEPARTRRLAAAPEKE